MPDLLAIAAVIAVCATVQSIFGLGLLVFGTPTLLMMGLAFPDVLTMLLPASMTISTLQVLDGRHTAPTPGPGVYAWCLPFIAVGLAFALGAGVHLKMDLLVGAMLLLTAAIRLIPTVRRQLSALVVRYRRGYLVAMGLVHGLSNMGGGLLAVYAANLHQDKSAIRYLIAHHYLLFGLIQCGVLLAMGTMTPAPEQLGGMVLAAAVYRLIGNRLYEQASTLTYQRLVTSFTGAYGAVMLARALL